MSVHNQFVRTNNSVESYHGYLRRIKFKAHPGVFEFLKMLVEVVFGLVNKMGRQNAGTEPEVRQCRKYVAQQKRIVRANGKLIEDGDEADQIRKFLLSVAPSLTELDGQFACGRIIKIT